jgi:4-hydroxy-3-polyprenylbenzoate decarboxylase
LLELHDAGAVVLPASPGFYNAPASVDQLVDFVAAKALDVLGVPHDLMTRWTGQLGAALTDHHGGSPPARPVP